MRTGKTNQAEKVEQVTAFRQPGQLEGRLLDPRHPGLIGDNPPPTIPWGQEPGAEGVSEDYLSQKLTRSRYYREVWMTETVE